MKCPFCGCQSFYLKDPDDEYETYEFDLEKDEVNFHSEVNEGEIKWRHPRICGNARQ